MRRWESTFGKGLPCIFIGGVLVSAVLALLAAGTGQVLAADFYVGGSGAPDRNPAQIDHNVFWNNHMNDVRLEQAKAPVVASSRRGRKDRKRNFPNQQIDFLTEWPR